MRACIRAWPIVLLCAALLVSSQPALADFTQQGDKLVGTETLGVIVNQGFAVAISADGSTAIVGGPKDNGSAGAAWVYTRSGGVWTQQTKLVGAGAAGPAQQGNSVALSADGNTAIVGGNWDLSFAGAAWVYTRNGTTWTQQGSKLVGTEAEGPAEQGSSVSLSADGNTAIVGGNWDVNGVGAAWVYTRSGAIWTQQGNKLVGTGAARPAQQGISVALSANGNTAIVGGPRDDPGPGNAWVWVRSKGGAWTQQGDKLVGTEAVGAASQGFSVALSADGNTAMVGGIGDNSGAGAAWVYTRNGTTWTQQGDKLVGTGAVGAANQGWSISLSADGDTAIVGGLRDGGGGTWVYTRSGINWAQQGDKLVGAGALGFAQQGASVSLSSDGNTAIIGGPGDDVFLGAAWVFTRAPTVTSVRPKSGGVQGGTNVTITGTRYTGATGVTFGGLAATNVMVVSPNTITATTPAHAAGSVNVVVASEHGSGTGAFTYLKISTTTSLGSSPNPSTIDQSVTFTAKVSGAGTTGTVTFRDGGKPLGSSELVAGSASFSIASLAVGIHQITATYGGDGNFAASTSAGLLQTVQGATTTSVSVTPNPSLFGQSVTFTAVVSASGATGTVTFKDGGTTVGSAGLVAGSASVSIASLAIGSHEITATYGGDGNFDASTSVGLFQKVNKGGTTTSVSALPNPSQPGKLLTFTATVAAKAPAAGTPAGPVTFKEGVTVLGSGTLASGKATFFTSNLTIGSHSVTASYAGTANFLASAGSVTVKVDPRVGPEFPVNTETANFQRQPSVARLANGFVIAWASNLQDGSGEGIFAQRYNATGTRLGAEFLVNTRRAGDQSQPSVAGLTNGFVVTWQSAGQDGGGLGIFGQRYDNTGVKAGTEFLVNTRKLKNQSQPSVAGLSGGAFVVAWASEEQDGSLSGIFAQRFNAAGAPAGAEFRVNSTTVGDQSQPSIAALEDGGFVVTWQSQDGSGLGIFGQRFTGTGAIVGGEFQVNTTAAGAQSFPSAAGLDDGGFVVAWQSAAQDGSGLGIFAQRYSVAGANTPKAGTQFPVNTATALDQSEPSVAAFPDGGFVVTWTSANQDGSATGVFAQVYRTDGARVGAEFRVNTTTAKNQSQPSAAAFSARDFVVVWTSEDQDGSLDGVFGQRFNVVDVASP
jgi:hypothetical protein